MALTYDEAQLLSTLSTDPAYLLLLDKLQAIIDSLTDKLHLATAQDTANILPVWKALRTVYIELRNTPQEVVSWLENLRKADENIQIPPNVKTGEQLNSFLQALEKQRDTDREPQSTQDLYRNTSPNPNSFGNII